MYEAAILKGHMFPPLCMVLFRFPLISATESQLTSDRGNYGGHTLYKKKKKSKYHGHDHDFDSLTLWNQTITVYDLVL